jgi:hypothetical protein
MPLIERVAWIGLAVSGNSACTRDPMPTHRQLTVSGQVLPAIRNGISNINRLLTQDCRRSLEHSFDRLYGIRLSGQACLGVSYRRKGWSGAIIASGQLIFSRHNRPPLPHNSQKLSRQRKYRLPILEIR